MYILEHNILKTVKLKQNFKKFNWVVYTSMGISIIFVILLLYLNLILKQQAKKQSQELAKNISEEIYQNIEGYFRDALTINRIYSEDILQFKMNKIPRLKVYSLLRNALKNNKNLLSIWTMWEPNAYDKLDKYYANDSLHDIKGSFSIGYYYENNSIKTEINDASDYSSSLYVIPKKTKHNIISDPHYYHYHRNKHVFFETSVVSPIMDSNNNFLGVIGIDVDLVELQKKLNTIHLYKSGFVSLLSNSGTIVTHPNSTLINKNIYTILDKNIKSTLDSLKLNKSFSTICNFKNLHTKSIRFFYPINLNYMVDPWYIMVEIPLNEINYFTNKLQFITFSLIFIFIILISYFIYDYLKYRKNEDKLIVALENTKVKTEALELSEQKFNIMFHQSPIAIVLSQLNTGIIENVNIAFEKIFGFTRDEVIGKTSIELNIISKENREKARIALLKDNKTSDVVIIYNNKFGIPLHCIGSAEIIEINKSKFVLQSITDITRLVKTTEKLIESEKKYRQLFENSGDAIILIKENKIIDFNKKTLTLFELKHEELLDKGLINLCPEFQPDCNSSEVEIQKIINNTDDEISQFFEWQFQKRNRKHFYAEVLLSKIQLQDSTYYLAAIRDISERKIIEKELNIYRQDLEFKVKERTEEITTLNEELSSANEELTSTIEELHSQKEELEKIVDILQKTQSQLIQSEKMAALGIMVAGVAHEINNPINFIASSISGLDQIIKPIIDLLHKFMNSKDYNNVIEIKNSKESLKLEHYLQNISKLSGYMEEGIKRATQIIRNLSAYSSSGNVKMEQNINALIDLNIEIIQHQIKNKITIEKHYGQLPLISCISGQINQVILNILSNAIQSIEGKGIISIETKIVNNDAIISISDSGKGIANEIVDKIFDPFFTTKDVGKGTGLGLYISYEIIKRHNGSIKVKSAEGKGSTFSIFLPIK